MSYQQRYITNPKFKKKRKRKKKKGKKKEKFVGWT
jgi:hypothetical protein